MSSNAASSLPTFAPKSRARLLAFGISLVISAPLTAQDGADVTGEVDTSEETSPPQPARPERLILDLSVTVPEDPSDVLVQNDCDEENDAARIANEIIVCRDLGKATDGSFDKAEWEKRYAEKTKGISTPNTFGIPNHGNAIGFGSVPPPAYILDFDELPETPEGSDADRIARGLPPLGEEELSEEEERARRAALGLSAPE
ncbi:MAG: hypothetical protein ABJP70_04015 [Erythrobacter sp.]